MTRSRNDDVKRDRLTCVTARCQSLVVRCGLPGGPDKLLARRMAEATDDTDESRAVRECRSAALG